MKFTNAYTETTYTSDTPLIETKLTDILTNWDKWNVMFDDAGNVKGDVASKRQYDNLMKADITAGITGQNTAQDVPYHEEDLEKLKTYLLVKVKDLAARAKRSPTKADVALLDAILQRIKKTGPAPEAKPQLDPANVTYAPGSKSKIGAGYKTDYVIKNGQMMTAKNAANS